MFDGFTVYYIDVRSDIYIYEKERKKDEDV